MVAASSPPAALVITTFELMVVGKQPVITRPTRAVVWIEGLPALEIAAVTPKKHAETTRSEVTCTMMWSRQLRMCKRSRLVGKVRPLTRKITATAQYVTVY